MSETLSVLLLGGAAQTLTLVAALWWFDHRRIRALRRQPGTIEHLAAEIKRVEAESRARDEVLRKELHDTIEGLRAHDDDLIERYTRKLYDQMSALMYRAAEGRALGLRSHIPTGEGTK